MSTVCQQCDYKNNNQLGNFKTRVESVHEGVRYPYNQCDYKAKQEVHLNKNLVTSELFHQ